MNKLWTDEAWKEYLYWQTQDKKTLKRINQLIRDIDRNGNNGIGKPEALSGNLTGFGAVELTKQTGLYIALKTDN
jgi:toxin YoeB